MGLLDAIAGTFGYTKAAPHGPGVLLTGGGGTGIQVDTLPRFNGTATANAYLNRHGDHAWVYSCIRVIRTKGAGVPLKVYRRDGETLKEQPNHPLQALLSYVNPFMSGYDLMEATHGFIELTGNAFWLLDRFIGGKPTEIYPLNPTLIKVVASRSKFIDGYIYDPTGQPKDVVPLKPEEVIHFKNWNPADPHYGQSPLSAAREAADSMLFADRYNKSFFANSAEPGGVLQSDEAIMDEGVRGRILAAWAQAHAGVRKAHKIALLEGGLKFIKTASTHQDMQFVELKRMSREDILAVYGIPPIMVGVFDEANYSNAKEQRRIFWVDSMVPRLLKIESVLNEWLAKPFGADLVLAHDLSGIEAMKQDEKILAEVEEIRTRSGNLTINEARKDRKLPPVPWGETWNAPIGLSPIEGHDEPEEPEPTPAPAPQGPPPQEPPKEPPKEPQDDGKAAKSSDPGAETPAPIISTQNGDSAAPTPVPAVPTTAPGATPPAESKVQDEEASKARRDRRWETFKMATESHEKKWISSLKRMFESLEAECQANLESGAWSGRAVQVRLDGMKNVKDAVDLVLYDRGEARRLFRKEGRKLYTFTVESAGVAEAAAYDLSVFDITNPRVTKWIDEKIFKFANQINETTETALRKTLTEAIANGDDINQVSARIADVFDIAKGSRAEMIARTEVVSASNYGSVASYEQSGVSALEWISARDSNVRESHNIDGFVVNMGQKFPNGLYYPGDPEGPAEEIINCRCNVAPITSRPLNE